MTVRLTKPSAKLFAARLAAILAAVCLVASAGGCAEQEAEVQPQESLGDSGSISEALAACVREKGWDAEPQRDGGVLYSYPSEQEEQFTADREACQEAVGANEPPPPMNADEAEAMFDALLEAAECVRGLGYPVDEPPSRQAAVEALMRPIINLGWDPYEHAGAAASSQEELNEIYTNCPSPLLQR